MLAYTVGRYVILHLGNVTPFLNIAWDFRINVLFIVLHYMLK